MRRIGSLFMVAQKGMIAGNKIKEVLGTPESVWGTATPTFDGLSLTGVSFAYPDEPSRMILKDLDMVFPAHGLYAIVGLSGAGKTTLATLLTSGVRPTAGLYRVGGQPIAAIARDYFFANAGLVSDNTHLFYGTIRDNFRIYAPGIADATIAKALEDVDLSYLHERNSGLDTLIEEEGANLSGGERQRLAFAAAIASPRRLWIFYEASSSVDADSAKIILAQIKRLSVKSLCLVITHKLAETQDADAVYVMKDGAVCEKGPVAGLLATGGEFSRLWQTQLTLERGV